MRAGRETDTSVINLFSNHVSQGRGSHRPGQKQSSIIESFKKYTHFDTMIQ